MKIRVRVCRREGQNRTFSDIDRGEKIRPDHRRPFPVAEDPFLGLPIPLRRAVPVDMIAGKIQKCRRGGGEGAGDALQLKGAGFQNQEIEIVPPADLSGRYSVSIKAPEWSGTAPSFLTVTRFVR